ERLTAGALHPLVALAHQRAQRGRRSIEDFDLVLVDHLPEAAEVGIIGHAFEHHRDAAIGQRAIDDVAVPGDPADVGRAPIDLRAAVLAGAIVEHVFVRHGYPHRIAAGGVEHALGLAGGAAGVEDEQRVFRAHFLRRAVGRLLGDGSGPVDVAAWGHRHTGAGVGEHDDAADLAVAIERGIDVGLQRNALAAAQALVGSDDHVAVAIDDA